MVIRLAVSTDLTSLKALILGGPHGSILEDFTLSDFVGPNIYSVVNENGAGIRAAVVADGDRSSSQPIIVYRLVFSIAGASGLLSARPLLAQVAQLGKQDGYTACTWNMRQDPAFSGFRQYCENRDGWIYLHDDPKQPNYDGGQLTRVMFATLNDVEANA